MFIAFFTRRLACAFFIFWWQFNRFPDPVNVFIHLLTLFLTVVVGERSILLGESGRGNLLLGSTGYVRLRPPIRQNRDRKAGTYRDTLHVSVPSAAITIQTQVLRSFAAFWECPVSQELDAPSNYSPFGVELITWTDTHLRRPLR